MRRPRRRRGRASQRICAQEHSQLRATIRAAVQFPGKTGAGKTGATLCCDYPVNSDVDPHECHGLNVIMAGASQRIRTQEHRQVPAIRRAAVDFPGIDAPRVGRLARLTIRICAVRAADRFSSPREDDRPMSGRRFPE
jgi:hypothetical protein